MELLEALRSRRSVKHFDPDHSIDDGELRHLLSNVALAPTSFNMQNWHFIAVREQATKEKLCAAAYNQPQVKDAALVVVCAGDYKAHERMARYLRHAPDEVREKLEPMIMGFYGDNESLRVQEACRSIGLAGMAMMLVAREMGYDSCPLIGFDPAKVSDVMGLDEDHPPLLMVTIGKPLEPARPRMGLLDFEEFVSLESFGNAGLKGEVPAS
jgi:nitroreductase